ncbi:MMPL family transporter [Rothia sp. AR01]|uniref:MMPL family transporter n=1 Tax=Rothia santali TaxID=2949643 RepID=A0A9X2HF15_9MICC|nr:MMPL family transporter [Rothia santali]MCP3426905.1 MMPL family transporter [Rothia santali]
MPAQHLDRGRRRVHWLRILIPALLVLAWFGAAGVGGPYFGKISEVSSEAATDRLPSSAESTRVTELSAEFSESDAIPAILVFERDGGLDPADAGYAADLAQRLADESLLQGQASPPIPSEDGQALQVVAPLSPDVESSEAVDAIRADLAETAPKGLDAYVTGPAGFVADLGEAFAGIDGILLGVALAVVFVILLIVYRSPLLPILVLLTSTAALSASILVIWHLADAGVLTINGQIQGILFILVIGAATDYSLLYTARYREALVRHRDRSKATWVALKGTIEPVAASGGTVIAGLLCLLFSELKTNAALGPVAGTGIVFSMLAALTFLPALLFVFGRSAFWPFRPRFSGADVAADSKLWSRVGAFVERSPRKIWLTSAVVLGILAVLAVQFRAGGVQQSDLILGPSDARDGQEVVAAHFPGGAGTPAQVVAPEGEQDDVVREIEALPGVASIAAVSADSPSGSIPVGEAAASAGAEADGGPGSGAVPGAGGAPAFPGAAPTVVDGRVLLQVTLADSPDTSAAQETVQQMRTVTDDLDDVLVGGSTAQEVDTLQSSIHDRALIIPVILVVITLILMLLLRSLLAPVLLVATTLLSYFSTLGVGSLVFEHVLGFPDADPTVPLYAFVFLVALGIDYNIFLMTRVREESLHHGTHRGVLRGVILTGGVITSAGVVLAATFAALGVIPVMFLAQIAFLVAFGVLLDATLVRALLVPALVYDVGDAVWWPSKLRHGPTRPDGWAGRPGRGSRRRAGAVGSEDGASSARHASPRVR